MPLPNIRTAKRVVNIRESVTSERSLEMEIDRNIIVKSQNILTAAQRAMDLHGNLRANEMDIVPKAA